MLLDGDDYLPISALQHYAFCPRQCALIHIERVWAENFWTAEGRLLHERVDGGEPEQRDNTRTERSVSAISHRLRIQGKLDLLEIEGNITKYYFPVEYKRGKPKIEDWDRVQLCAQALCLEEMLQVTVDCGALWYWQVRKREEVIFDLNLRQHTEKLITDMHAMLISNITPQPIFTKRCQACSLIESCEPKALQNDISLAYVSEIFKL